MFFDYTAIASGDFERVILGHITARAHFLVLLTPSALEKCGDPSDWLLLDALREELRKRDYLPVLFDFEQPNQTTDETISTLAGMARFVIADLTDAKSVLQELRNLVPNRPSLPIQLILLAGQSEPGMFDFFRRFPWVLETQLYETAAELLANLGERVIEPAERKLAAGKTG